MIDLKEMESAQQSAQRFNEAVAKAARVSFERGYTDGFAEGYKLGQKDAQPEPEKYEYHYDHTDCIWYRPEARNRCPVTCAQYRDGWNDAMNYIFRDGKGYKPYRRDKQYGE